MHKSFLLMSCFQYFKVLGGWNMPYHNVNSYQTVFSSLFLNFFYTALVYSVNSPLESRRSRAAPVWQSEKNCTAETAPDEVDPSEEHERLSCASINVLC